MPNRLTLECPIDGLTITNNAALQVRGDPNAEHVHVDFPSAALQCANGHRWQIAPTESLQLRRTG